MTYVSSLSLSMPMRLSVMQAQSDLSKAQTEISSGTYADIGLALGGRTGRSLSLKSEIDQLTSFKTSNALAATRLDATSNALGSLLTTAQSLSSSLITAASAGASATALTSSAQSALQGLTATLNTSAAGQFIFGGINSDTAPVNAYADGSSAKQAVDKAFQKAFGMSPSDPGAASISASDMQSFLDGPFASLFDDSGWQTNWSGASNETMQTDVAQGQTLSTSVSANDTSFRQMAQAYTMLSEFTGSNFGEGARSAVIASASKLVNGAIAGVTDLQSRVGVTQSTLSSVTDRSTAQIDVLTSNVNDLESVDTYALSTKVTALQTQLEESYSLTSQLSKLSLVNYLTG